MKGQYYYRNDLYKHNGNSRESNSNEWHTWLVTSMQSTSMTHPTNLGKMSGSAVGRLYDTHCKSQCRIYPARCYATRYNVVIIPVSYTRKRRDTNQNREMCLISGRERSSPQVSTTSLFDLSMRESYTLNYTTYAYATDPTRANAIRAPSGPAWLMASPEPKNSPVPNVPEIWKIRGQRSLIAWRPRTCSYPIIRDAWVQRGKLPLWRTYIWTCRSLSLRLKGSAEAAFSGGLLLDLTFPDSTEGRSFDGLRSESSYDEPRSLRSYGFSMVKLRG
jgi:hypothetical protein